MIEQTPLVVSKWAYRPPAGTIDEEGKKLTSYITFDVKQKTAPLKKGIACRFTIEFVFEKETLLEYTAENSYVIDNDDTIDRNELHTMIRNTYSQFRENFDLRKLGTVLWNKSLLPFDEKQYDLDPVMLLLQ